MSRRKKILFSARDPGAAGHIKALIHYFCAHGRFEVILTASGVALEMLAQEGLEPIPFHLPGGIDSIQPGQDPGLLLQEAKGLLDRLQPDAVLTSLSSLGVGIDEALLATAEVPTFALQDFWGDVNLGLGVPADLYLVMDDFAAELSRKRWGVKALAVGAPKYTLYRDLDIMALRRKTRRLLGAKPDDRVIGWFGQSPEMPGHEAVFQDFLNALASIEEKPKLFLREHPKFLWGRLEHLEAAQAILGMSVADTTGTGTTEEWLAACDLVVTLNSLCGLDHGFLSAYSPGPIGSVLYLATNKLARQFISEKCGMLGFPILQQGIGHLIINRGEITSAVCRLCEYSNIESYFYNSKKLSTRNTLAEIAYYIEAGIFRGDKWLIC
jgi:hypothetical protein